MRYPLVILHGSCLHIPARVSGKQLCKDCGFESLSLEKLSPISACVKLFPRYACTYGYFPFMTKKKDFVLTQVALNRLLDYLNTDREIAADQFEMIRTKLITFFECRGCSNPEDYTDITIYRVARIITEGREIHTTSALET